MKRLLFVVLALMACSALMAQKHVSAPSSKGFIYATAGAAIATGDFASSNAENQEAGMANTGFTLNLHGGYYFNSGSGLKVTGFYSQHSVENILGAMGNADMGHWTYVGLSAGPLYNFPLTNTSELTLATQVGIASVSTPEVSYQGFTYMKRDQSITMPISFGAAVHLQLGGRSKLMLGTDYLYMKPKFTVSVFDAYGNQTAQNIEQKMGVLNVYAGIGLSF